MSVEYSETRKKRMRGHQARRRSSYPSASPVTITRADGTIEVQPPLSGGDRPFRPRLNVHGKWTEYDTHNSTLC